METNENTYLDPLPNFVSEFRSFVRDHTSLIKGISIIADPVLAHERVHGVISEEARVLYALWMISFDEYLVTEDYIQKELDEPHDPLDPRFITRREKLRGALGLQFMTEEAMKNLFWTLVREEFPESNNASFMLAIKSLDDKLVLVTSTVS